MSDKKDILEQVEQVEQERMLELRSPEVQQILGKPPRWIIRWGITLILSIVGLLFLGSFLFQYPDVISATIEVHTENMPAQIVAKTSGKIDTLFVAEGQIVPAEEYLAVLENTAVFEDVLTLKKLLTGNDTLGNLQLSTLNKPLSLGDMQSHFYAFQKSFEDHRFFSDKQYHLQKISALKKQLSLRRQIELSARRQLKTSAEQYKTQRRLFAMDSNLFAKKVISQSEFETAKSTLLQSQQSYENSQSSIHNEQMSIALLEQNILEIEQQADEQQTALRLALSGALEALNAAILSWEQMYVFKSAVAGKVALTKFWQKNQNITAGEQLLSIIPQAETSIMGRILLPTQGAGKVKVGQAVNVKFDGFPHLEYGMVRGKVSIVSSVPITNQDGKFFMVDVVFPDGLKTNYGKTLEFAQLMSGTAEIITADRRLAERLLEPVKSLWKR
ncbi:MAG: HlyD family secretion protein [Bacteroidales bacterium]|jgi:multidrug resistance efflux pump|nr:HlyD family secretion protein [Bacteroidales bacterium]